MSIDKQRIAAVAALERLGFRWSGVAWERPSASVDWAASDAMHELLMNRAERLAGCCEDSDEDTELAAIAEALETYEAERWPKGHIRGRG